MDQSLDINELLKRRLLGGDKYDEYQRKRQEIVDQNTSDSSGPNWAAGIAALGAGLSGRDAIGAGQSILSNQEKSRQRRLDELDQSSKLDQDRSSKVYDYLIKKYELDEKNKLSKEDRSIRHEEREDKRIDQKLSRDALVQNRKNASDNRLDDRKELADYRFELAKEGKLDSKKLKDQGLLEEVENRRQTIDRNLDDIDKMLVDGGTSEFFGPHNEILTGKLNAVATDTAKLFDPESVARPSEVALALQSLFKPSMTKMTDNTAREIIKKYKDDMGARADTAYKVKGLTPPPKKDVTSPQLNPGEVERMGPDGEIAIFDVKTKKFLRHK